MRQQGCGKGGTDRKEASLKTPTRPAALLTVAVPVFTAQASTAPPFLYSRSLLLRHSGRCASTTHPQGSSTGDAGGMPMPYI